MAHEELLKVMENNKGIHILPLESSEQKLPEGWDYLVTQRKPDVNEDLFIKEENGNKSFGLKKQFVINLAADAGVKFTIDSVKVSKIVDANGEITFEAKACAIIETPVGEKSYTSTSSADLTAMTEKYKEILSRKVLRGIPEDQYGKEIAERYKGEWKTSESGKADKKAPAVNLKRLYFLEPKEVPRYIADSGEKYMNDLSVKSRQAGEKSSPSTAALTANTKKYKEILARKVLTGIPDNQRGKEIAALYKGEWKTFEAENEEKNDPKKDQKKEEPRRYYLDAEEIQRYAEDCGNKYMLDLRLNGRQRTETAAIMRMIKSLINIKPVYPYSDIDEPFVVIRPYKTVKAKQLERETADEIKRLKQQIVQLNKQLNERNSGTAGTQYGKVDPHMFN